MVTYEYYKDIYKGEAEESTFDKYVIEAEIEYHNYTLKPKKMTDDLLKDEKSALMIKTCICKMIDNLIAGAELLKLAKLSDKKQALGVKSESVKDHSISYGNTSTSDTEQDIHSNNIIIMNRYLTRLGLLYRGARYV